MTIESDTALLVTLDELQELVAAGDTIRFDGVTIDTDLSRVLLFYDLSEGWELKVQI